MEPVLAEALHTFRRFAEKHDYDVVVGGPGRASGRPPAWGKVALMWSLLDLYDVVLWIDADAIILDDNVDPVQLLAPGDFQALVQHDWKTQLIPNTGVWLVRGPRAKEFLQQVWDKTEFIDDQWWENAAVMDLLGYSIRPCRPIHESPWMEGTRWIDETWNRHVGISGLAPARVRHYAGFSNSYRRRRMSIDREPNLVNRMLGTGMEFHRRVRRIRHLLRRTKAKLGIASRGSDTAGC